MMDKLYILVKKFEDWLQKENGKEVKDDRNTRLYFFQTLKEKIINDTVTESEILEIPDKIFSIFKMQRNMAKSELEKNFITAKKMLKEIIENANKGKSLDEIIKELEETNLMIKYFTYRQISELLCLFYPDRYWIINNGLQKGIEILKRFEIWTKELDPEKIEDYDKLGELLTLILEQLRKDPNLKEILGRTPNYYDADAFLWHLPEFVKDDIPLSDIVQPKSEHEQCKDVLSQLLKYFISKGFYFDQALITAFYSALKTKGFVILSGLTGTGKTKLAQLFAELLCPNCFKKQSKEENTQNPQDELNTQIAQNSSNNQNQCKCTHLFLPVRPDWRDSKALLGYYNPITGKYERTPLLDFILKAMDDYNKTDKNNVSPYFIILDEMNLSHVEYYFADFLSVLESGRDENENYWTKETIKLHNIDNRGEEKIQIPKEIKLPPNLYIIGSVNIDETTYMFSPKVLDRAFTIEFRDVDFEGYLKGLNEGSKESISISEDKLKELRNVDKLEELRNALLEDLRNGGKFCAAIADKDEVKSAIKELSDTIKNEINPLNQILQPHDLHFGYRVLDEIALFIKYAINAPEGVGKLTLEDALDFAVLMKVLPKFHGPRQKLERPLWLVLKWCAVNQEEFDNKKPGEIVNLLEDLLKGKVKISEKFKYPRTAIKVLTMLRQLYETGFTSFA